MHNFPYDTMICNIFLKIFDNLYRNSLQFYMKYFKEDLIDLLHFRNYSSLIFVKIIKDNKISSD